MAKLSNPADYRSVREVLNNVFDPSTGKLDTTASISGDLNIDSTSISVQAYVGKPSGANADFVTARTGATNFTCATLPSEVTAINTVDIELIRQINTSGAVVAAYSRDDATITCSGTDPTTVTVTGAVFGATDTIILYTNIYKPITADVQLGAVELKNATTDDRAIIKGGNTAAATDVALLVADANVKGSVDTVNTTLGSPSQETTLQSIDTKVATETTLATLATQATLSGMATGQVDGSQKTQVVDNSGNVIGATSNALDINIKSSGVTIGGNAEQTPDAVAATKIVQIGAIAESTVPTEVADGDAVAQWHDTFGRQITKGYGFGNDAINVSEVAPALLLTQEAVDLNAVTATGAGASYDVSNFSKVNFHITSSSVTTGGTVLIQSSLDGTNFVTLHTETVTTNTTVGISFEGKWKYLRANLSARTDGTYTIRHIAGN